MTNDVDNAVAVVCGLWPLRPVAGIILGTGLGRFVEEIEVDAAIGYDMLPHWGRPTSDGHKGRLVCGSIAGRTVIAMDGRCHAYEGYSHQQITLPVRVMQALGIEVLILSNAAGGMNLRFSVGDVMVINDHIDLMRRRSSASSDCGQPHRKFEYYCPRLIAAARASARQAGFELHRGTYAAMTGPNYETRAEYRFLRAIGADAVGMSTVPEVLVAAECGLRVLALSAITNICPPYATAPARHDDVMAAAQRAEPKMRRIILDVIASQDRGQAAVETSAAAVSANGRSRHSLASHEATAKTMARE